MIKNEEIIKAELELMSKHKSQNDPYVCNKCLLMKLITNHCRLFRILCEKGA